MGSTNVVLYNVLSVLDLVGHSELLDVSAACYPKASDRLSSHEINRTSWGEGGSYQQINHFSGLCQGLPSSMESRKKVSFIQKAQVSTFFKDRKYHMHKI